MIANIIGIIWVVLGLLWTIKPKMLRNRLIKKMNRKMRWTIFGVIFMLVFSLLGAVIKSQGLWGKIAGLIGIFILIRVILFFTSQASKKVSDFWSKKPILYFRIWGIVALVSGILLILT